MKFGIRNGVLIVTVVLLMGAAARANTLTANMVLTGVPAGDPTLTINDAALGTVTGYIDPYNGTMNGQSVLLWCIDPDQESSIGASWTAYVQTTGSSLANTYQQLNNSLSLSAANTLYDELAGLVFLDSQTTNGTTKTEIQGAIWQLANQGAIVADPSLTFPGASSSYLTAEEGYYDNAAATAISSGFEVVTPVGDNQQEYMVLTPEPSTLLLLCAGLVGLMVMARRRNLVPAAQAQE